MSARDPMPSHAPSQNAGAVSDETRTKTAEISFRNVAQPDQAAEGDTIDTDRQRRPGALALARGACRLLLQMGSAVVTECSLPNGRRADLAALDKRGCISIVEIKSSPEDFRADQKWPDYLTCCDAFYFAVAETFPRDLIPVECGLIVADAYDAAIIRPSPIIRLGTAKRRAVTLCFAITAAQRLHRLADPLAFG